MVRSADLVRRLEGHGLRKRSNAILTCDIGEDILGWVGLNQGRRHHPANEVEVAPVIGVRHQAIERMVAELRGLPFHDFLPPTISTQIGYLSPSACYLSWTLTGVPDDVAPVADAISDLAVPFWDRSTLATVCEQLDEGLGIEDQLVYRRPVAWHLAGEADKTAAAIDAAELRARGRTDPAAADLTAFVAACRERCIADGER